MSRIFRVLAPLLLVLLLVAPVLAQSNFYLYDEVDRLNDAQVEQAAQPLINRGARVALYLVQSGTANEFQQRLEQDGLALSNGQIRNELIGVFVSLDDRYSEIRYGDNWTGALNSRVASIRENQLNANLADGDFTAAFTETLGAIGQAIGAETGGGQVPVPVQPQPSQPQQDTGGGSGLLGLLGVGAVAGGGYLAYRAFSKRRQGARTLGSAREAMEQARQQAGAAIADFGRALGAARDKAPYDQVSYPPDEVERLGQLQAEAERHFVEAQQRFAAANQALAQKQQPTEDDYKQIAGLYEQAVEPIQAAQAALAQAQERRAELDKINAQAPAEIERARQAYSDARERIEALSGDFANPNAVLAPVEQQIARAEHLRDAFRAADATAAAQAAAQSATALSQTLARYADLREGISTGRAATERVASQGYRVDAGLKAFDNAERLLRQAATAMEQDIAAAVPLLDQAEAAREEGVGRGGGMPALQHQNDDRLPGVKQAGEQLAAYIAEGRKAFDLVDEFAEATWSDIRGNGSEAQAAAVRAQELYERAVQRNTMEAQDFYDAKQDLDQAEQDIAYARSLIDAIMQRLKDLENARSVARQEIDAAYADIERGWAFVRSNDPDVGKEPEAVLQQANTLLRQAQNEMSQQRPNWLALVRQAQEANRLADQALERAQGQVADMNKLREQVARARQLATAEVQKIAQFASLHDDDLPPEAQAQINGLQANVQAAYAAFQAAEQTEEEQRAAALREALRRYTALEQQADQVYEQVYGAFQRVEQLRRKVTAEADRAEQAIIRAEQLMRNYASYIHPRSEGVIQLEQARTSLRSIGKVRDEDDMQRALTAAQEARAAAERAELDFRQQASSHTRSHRRGSDLGDLMTGMFIGGMLNSGRPRHGSGWGGSWGGGGSFGGGGGGSFGRGGGSGGSWGGGGGSGGGW